MTGNSPFILVVEDDPDLRECIETTLSSMHFSVSGAANGKEALEAIERRWPDLVLLDMKMPIMDGWAFARALDARGERPTIVVMTAAPDPAERAREVRAQGWLGKPFELRDLEGIVRRFVPDA